MQLYKRLSAAIALAGAIAILLFRFGPLSERLGPTEVVDTNALHRLQGEGEQPLRQRILVNINTASIEELQQIGGVGPVLAEAIYNHRNEHGPFESIDQLIEVSGIGEKSLERMRLYCYVETAEDH